MTRKYQISRHVFLVERRRGRVYAVNAATERSVALTRDQWLALAPFEGTPRPIDNQHIDGIDDDIFSALVSASILVDAPEQVDLAGKTAALRLELNRIFKRYGNAQLRQIDSQTGDNLGRTFDLGAAYFKTICSQKFEEYHHYYRGHWLRFLLRYMIGLFRHLAAYDRQLHSPTPYKMDVELCLDAMRRPEPNYDWEQQPCMPVTSTERANRVLSHYPNGARVLVIGDDDLVSLALGRYRQFEVTTLEIDPKLVEVLTDGIARRGLSNITITGIDIGSGLPTSMQGQFDVVITDPPYAASGLDLFLKVAQTAFTADPGPKMLFLSTNPGLHEDPLAFEESFCRYGFLLLHEISEFNQYLVFDDHFTDRHFPMLRQIDFPLKSMEQLLACPYYYANFYEVLATKNTSPSAAFRSRALNRN